MDLLMRNRDIRGKIEKFDSILLSALLLELVHDGDIVLTRMDHKLERLGSEVLLARNLTGWDVHEGDTRVRVLSLRFSSFLLDLISIIVIFCLFRLLIWAVEA